EAIVVTDDGGGGSGDAGSINGQPTAADSFNKASGSDVQANIGDLTAYSAAISDTGRNVTTSAVTPMGNMATDSLKAFTTPGGADALGLQPEAALAADLNGNAASQFQAFFKDL